MTVSVEPQTFHYVLFEAAAIGDVAAIVLEQLAMTEHDVHIAVDETTPVSRVRVEMGDPIVVRAESGAFENARRPRQLSQQNTALNLGRMLLRVRDRTDGSFGEAPPDDTMTLAHVAAWDAYIVGRLERSGQTINRQRFLYNFRNRHGFTDTGDAAFEQLWSADRLTWNELASISAMALAAKL